MNNRPGPLSPDHRRYATSHSSTSTRFPCASVSTALKNQSGIVFELGRSHLLMVAPRFGCKCLQGSESLQMMVDVAEHRVDHRQPLEVVADAEFFGHAHAAVQLNRLLADEAS